MKAIAFVITAGFYFWAGPIAILTALQKPVTTKNTKHISIALLCAALLSWGITVLLTICVSHWSPNVLPREMVEVAYRYGWIYIFITSLPAAVFWFITVTVMHSSSKRFVVGNVIAAIPYLLMLCWYLPRITE